MPSMPCACKNVGGGVWDTDDRDGTGLLGTSENTGTVPVVCSGGRSGVAADIQSDSERCGMGVAGGVPPPV